ncbi:MAG: hypothetical protein IPM56_00855 [Ignavibacteriales bacterium]|nr:MAG: hypothetical protein IPM56_00855 [Ignavibacteriales bacterium]
MIRKILFFIVLLLCSTSMFAQEFETNLNAELVSRYIWRGLNVNDAVNIQPALTFSAYGFSLGFWGSYSLSSDPSNTKSALGQELDTWLGYTHCFNNGMSVTALITDYYFAIAGIKWGNFNDYDDPDGPGAHVIEAGLSVKGPECFPITLSGYLNFYNDAGNNIYFQADYPVEVQDVSLNFFVGGTTGSAENPFYYGSEKLNLINVGVKASKSVKITEEYSLPVSVSFIGNPNTETTYLVFGLMF